MFNPTHCVSPYDVNMAYDADFDGVIPYTEVRLDDIHDLIQDTIFTRGSKRTGIFIGGHEFGLATDMLYRAKAAMVPPFAVSVFADPSGAVTTAAAILSCIEYWLKNELNETLKNKNIHILGGTGPVGLCTGVLASNCGAEVYIASRRGKKVAQIVAEEYNSRFAIKMQGVDYGSDKALLSLLEKSDIMINTAKAGLQVLNKSQLKQASKLIVAADVNAIPPLGIEGIELNDMGKELDFTPNKTVGFGAMTIGCIKNKVHSQMFEMMRTTDKPLYLGHEEAFEIAREYACQKA